MKARALDSFKHVWMIGGAIALIGLAFLVGSAGASGATWTAGMEGGSLSEWNGDGGGDINVNTGNGVGVASTDVAHSGSYSLKMTINSQNSTNAVRFFRWGAGTGYYSAYYYFPQVYSGINYWNVFQFKDTANNPAWVVNVENRNGQMDFWLYNAYTGQVYNQSVKTISTNTWTQLQAYWVPSSTNTGQITIWQDGVQLFNLTGLQTIAAGTTAYWGVSNYSDNVNPAPSTIYVDDVAISPTFVQPGGVPAPTNTPAPTAVPATATPAFTAQPVATATPAPTASPLLKSPAVARTLPINEWKGDYFKGSDPNASGSPVYTDYESSLDHEWGTGAPAPNLPTSNYSASYNGYWLLSAKSYTFSASSSVGMRVWVDGVKVIDCWTTGSQVATVSLGAGYHNIGVDYTRPGSGNGFVHLSWQ